MARSRGADDGVAPADHDHVADPIVGQLEAPARLLAVEHRLHPRQLREPLDGVLDARAFRQVDGGERAERAVVDDVGIGDRQDHARPARAQPRVEHILKIDDLRPSRRVGLGVHAVVGGERDRRAEAVEPREVAVHHPVEGVGGRRARRVLVLDVVGGRQVHDVGSPRLHEPDARREDELAEVGAVDGRQRPAHERQRVGDAVLRLGGLVGLLGREADALHLVTEQAS